MTVKRILLVLLLLTTMGFVRGEGYETSCSHEGVSLIIKLYFYLKYVK